MRNPYQRSGKLWVKLAIGSAILFGVLLALGGWAWHAFTGPLYEPGQVRAAKHLDAPLEPPPTADEQDGFWQVTPDVRLRYQAVGAGPAVLVVHGGPGFPPGRPWRGLEPLAAERRVFFYDQRGCGGSTQPFSPNASDGTYANMVRLDQELGIAAQIADIERIRRTLDVERLELVGHSYGALLATLYAVEFPAHVGRLVLVAPADLLRLPATDDLFNVIERRLAPELRASYGTFREEYFDFSRLFERSERELELLQLRFFDYYSAASDRRRTLPPPNRFKPDELDPVGGWMAFANYLSMGRHHDWTDALDRVTAPTLVIHGTQDLQSRRVAEHYAGAIPGAVLETIDSGHMPFETRPEAFGALLARFLLDREQLGDG